MGMSFQCIVRAGSLYNAVCVMKSSVLIPWFSCEHFLNDLHISNKESGWSVPNLTLLKLSDNWCKQLHWLAAFIVLCLELFYSQFLVRWSSCNGLAHVMLIYRKYSADTYINVGASKQRSVLIPHCTEIFKNPERYSNSMIPITGANSIIYNFIIIKYVYHLITNEENKLRKH